MVPSISEPGTVYEVKLVAYNGNGESDSSTRLVSLVEERMSNPTTGEYDHTLSQQLWSVCCDKGRASTPLY